MNAWLKYSHVKKDPVSSCPRHDIEYGLSEGDGEPARPVTCAQCLSLHKLFFEVRYLAMQPGVDASAVKVVDDIYHKLHLFMGHRIRVVNQQ